MILNDAENIMVGDTEVDAVYLGDEEIWSRSSAIELDVTRFDPSNPKLYDKKGNELATLSMMTGSFDGNVYTTEDGLRLTSATTSAIPVEFNKSDPWTLTFKFKALNTSMSDNIPSSLINTPGFNVAVMYYYQYSPQSILFCVKGLASFYDTIYRTNGTKHGNYGSSWADLLIPFNNFADYEQEIKFVNDGEYCEIYCNGLIKGKCESSLLTDISIINLASLNSFPNNKTNFITTGLKIEYFANRKQSFKVYRFVFSKYRAYDTSLSNSYCFSRLCLYDANNNRLDTNSKCIAGECIIAYGEANTGEYYNRNTKMLVSNNTGVFVGDTYYKEGHTEDVFMFVPATLPELAAYSIITSPEGTSADFDPVSWTLQTTDDGGLTWTELDTKTDYNTPTARSTETQKFIV